MNLALTPLRYRTIMNKAWPIILANAAVPMLGLVDTAVIGHFGQAKELAALALASLLFSFLYWGFGFLRMGITGFIARADGAGDTHAAKQAIAQSMLLALVISLTLVVAQYGILHLGLALLSPPENVGPALESYFSIRIWAAPATLLTYVVSGVLIGRGNSALILILQLCLNGMNASLDVLFAGYFQLGIEGIALGTCIAEYCTMFLALFLLFRRERFISLLNSLRIDSLWLDFKALLIQNRDLFIRTLFLLLSFAFFARIAGQYGDTQLAANHILLQFIAFSAFFLDGYAHVLESLVGRAVGSKRLDDFDQALFKSSVLAGITALVLGCIVILAGRYFIALLTDLTQVSLLAQTHTLWAGLYIILAVAAFQLDGLFIGAGYSSAMRNASVVSCVIFIGAWYSVFSSWQVKGLWWAFIFYVCCRALALLWYLPSLRRQLQRQ